MAPNMQQANAIAIGLSTLENLANKSSVSNDNWATFHEEDKKLGFVSFSLFWSAVQLRSCSLKTDL